MLDRHESVHTNGTSNSCKRKKTGAWKTISTYPVLFFVITFLLDWFPAVGFGGAGGGNNSMSFKLEVGTRNAVERYRIFLGGTLSFYGVPSPIGPMHV